MIKLRRLNETQVVVNSDLIEFIETTPDTVLTLTTGQKIIVAEAADDVIDKVVEFRRRIFPYFRIVHSQSAVIEERPLLTQPCPAAAGPQPPGSLVE
ncbi:MAG: flagellar FlbD family protein [Acidobacteriota bacterium]